MNLPYFDANAVRAALPYERAIRAIEDAVRADTDPELDGPRLFADAPDGEFLLMPAQGTQFSGLKALTLAPNNPARGLEKIQGVYVLYSSDTLAPVAIMEGSSLTAIRTPAVTLAAIRALDRAASAGHGLPSAPRVLIFGAGVQARGCIRATRAAYPEATYQVIGRSSQRLDSLVAELAPEGIEVARPSEVASAVAEADIIICATTGSAPLFDGSLVKDTAIVAAIGTHGRDLREVDDALVSRADIAVEGRASAQRENGNLATAVGEAEWRDRPPVNLRALVRGELTRRPGHPAFYTGVGMSWEDLVCATVVFTDGHTAQKPHL